MSGRTTAYSIPGLTVKTPTVQPEFTGQPYDQLLPTVVGASVFKGNVLELGAIMRGPFHDPATSYYVFAFNRARERDWARPSRPPRDHARRPGNAHRWPVRFHGVGNAHRPDERLGAGHCRLNITIRGPVVRVYLNTNQLPSKGWPIQKYRFAFWTQTQPGNDITTVADFAPETSMIPIAVLRNVGQPDKPGSKHSLRYRPAAARLRTVDRGMRSVCAVSASR